jgi:hypothetical protein
MVKKDDIVKLLKTLFPLALKNDNYLSQPNVEILIQRLANIDVAPIGLTHFNQILHLNHEAGISKGFFDFYFCYKPTKYPYNIDCIYHGTNIDNKMIMTLHQLEYGFKRFMIDALLFWGDFRNAHRELRNKTFQELEELFESKCFDSQYLKARGIVLPFKNIDHDDRYLISEMAETAYGSDGKNGISFIERVLIEEYQKSGRVETDIASLVGKDSQLAKSDPGGQYVLNFASTEFHANIIKSEDEIRELIKPITEKYLKARKSALENTKLYLSIVNDLDVYVATSMRTKEDFVSMAKDCDYIFKNNKLEQQRLRYFDPTMSAADVHEDKGIIECLMVKCSKTLLYFAGEKDSYGKDAEVAMALSLGHPAIILCPQTVDGERRMKFFRDTHPLSRLINFETGVVVGSMITQDNDVAIELLSRVFDNSMEYELTSNSDGYFRLKEKLTQSVVRVQTNSKMLRESFWNYYHDIP